MKVSVPIYSPYGLTRLAYGCTYVYAYFTDACKKKFIKLLDEGNGAGESITKGDVSHGQCIVTTMAYTLLGCAMVEEIATLFLVK